MSDPLRDAEGRCTICGRIECRYPAGQSCFAAAIEELEDKANEPSSDERPDA